MNTQEYDFSSFKFWVVEPKKRSKGIPKQRVRKMNYYEAAKAVADTIAKTTTPLSANQIIALSGAMAVYLDKARDTAIPDTHCIVPINLKGS